MSLKLNLGALMNSTIQKFVCFGLFICSNSYAGCKIKITALRGATNYTLNYLHTTLLDRQYDVVEDEREEADYIIDLYAPSSGESRRCNRIFGAEFSIYDNQGDIIFQRSRLECARRLISYSRIQRNAFARDIIDMIPNCKN